MNAETLNTVLDEMNSEEAYPSVSDDVYLDLDQLDLNAIRPRTIWMVYIVEVQTRNAT